MLPPAGAIVVPTAATSAYSHITLAEDRPTLGDFARVIQSSRQEGVPSEVALNRREL
jgi:hypothetical protein